MAPALSHEHCPLALNDLLSGNLDTIGHSQARHSIQDRALEHQFFELIINLATVRPIAEDRLEAKDLSLRPNSGDDSRSLPPLAPNFSDPPQVPIASVALRLAFGVGPNPWPCSGVMAAIA